MEKREKPLFYNGRCHSFVLMQMRYMHANIICKCAWTRCAPWFLLIKEWMHWAACMVFANEEKYSKREPIAFSIHRCSHQIFIANRNFVFQFVFFLQFFVSWIVKELIILMTITEQLNSEFITLFAYLRVFFFLVIRI